MKRKTVEKIPPLPVEKSESKKCYVAAAVVEEIKGEKHLIVDIYRNLKKNLKQPFVRVCATENDYGNFVFEEKKWNQKMLGNIRTPYKYFLFEQNISISDEYTKIIKQFCKNNYSWYDSLISKVQNLNRDKANKAYERREEKLQERLNNMPDIPEGFYNWVESELFKNTSYMFYKRKGRYAEFYCSCCGKSYRLPVKRLDTYEGQFEHIAAVPKQNQRGRCELCDSEVIFKAIGHGTQKEDKRYCYLIQPYGEKGAVLRYFDIYKKSSIEEGPVYEDYEQCRCFYIPEVKKVQKDYYYISCWNGMGSWHPHNIPGMQNITLKAAKLWPGSYEQMKNTLLEYSGMEAYSENYDLFEVEKYIDTYYKYPCLEMISKLAMYHLAERLIRQEYWEVNCINPDGKTVDEVLMIPRKKLKKLIKEKGNQSCHDVLKVEKVLGIDLKEFEEDILADFQIDRMNLEGMLRHVTAEQAINRICKYANVERKDIWDLPSCAISKLRSVAQMYADYISLRYQAGYDMQNQVYLHPRNLKEQHDLLVLETNAKKNEADKRKKDILYANIERMYEELNTKYAYEDDKFVIRPASCASEIMSEGQFLHHCVGGDNYLKGHATGNSYILFLRPKAEKRIPYVTIQIKGYTIIQWYGLNNKKPQKQVIEKWLKSYLQNLKSGLIEQKNEEMLQQAAG